MDEISWWKGEGSIVHLLCINTYSRYFSRDNIFMKVVILGISCKIFCGRVVCVKTTPILGAHTRYHMRYGHGSCFDS